MVKTVIGVPTSGRQEDLGRLLAALTADYGHRPDVGLLVVDNAPGAPSSRAVFEECSRAFAERRCYVVEPTRGYASVRNALLANAGGADAIAMIDDDEVPASGWLDSLLAVRRETGSDIVSGPVVSEFPVDAPSWFERSGLFAPKYRPEGAELALCSSNNTLISLEAARRVSGGFDDRFNYGGEDSDFFSRAHAQGCKIVWTNRAIVRERVSAERLSVRWLFRRSMRTGNNRTLIELGADGRASPGPLRVLKAAVHLLMGVYWIILMLLFRDRAHGLRAVYRIGLACGMFFTFIAARPLPPNRPRRTVATTP